MSFIPEYLGGSVFIICRFLWRLDNNSSFHIKPIMYDGVVVLTNVPYIFLLVLILALGETGVLQGRWRCLSMCLNQFRRKGSFIKVFHQSKKCFFVVTATDMQVNTCCGFSLSTVLMR